MNKADLKGRMFLFFVFTLFLLLLIISGSLAISISNKHMNNLNAMELVSKNCDNSDIVVIDYCDSLGFNVKSCNNIVDEHNHYCNTKNAEQYLDILLHEKTRLLNE
jgi:hypothetical protein